VSTKVTLRMSDTQDQLTALDNRCTSKVK